MNRAFGCATLTILLAISSPALAGSFPGEHCGFNNKMLFVVPEWNLVFVRMGVDGNPPEGKPVAYDSFFRELAKAIE